MEGGRGAGHSAESSCHHSRLVSWERCHPHPPACSVGRKRLYESGGFWKEPLRLSVSCTFVAAESIPCPPQCPWPAELCLSTWLSGCSALIPRLLISSREAFRRWRLVGGTCPAFQSHPSAHSPLLVFILLVTPGRCLWPLWNSA